VGIAALGLQPSKALIAGLTAQALATRSDFDDRGQIYTTLWVFAKMGLQPSRALLAGLTARAVEVRGDFNPKHISSTLWAFATLGLQPSEELMVGLMKQAVAVQGDFKPQNIANSLWGFATLGIAQQVPLGGNDAASVGGAGRLQTPGDCQHGVCIRDAGTAAQRGAAGRADGTGGSNSG